MSFLRNVELFNGLVEKENALTEDVRGHLEATIGYVGYELAYTGLLVLGSFDENILF